jgi:hypothetical protein
MIAAPAQERLRTISMWTGRQTLASIEQAIGNLHQEEAQLDGAIKTATADAGRLRTGRDDALKELARVKLDEITAGRLVRNLDASERRAVQLLENGRNRMASEADRKAATLAEVQQAETARHAAAEAVEQALAAVETVSAATAKQVQTTPAWQTLAADFKAADDIAGEAEKKATQSQAELGAKQKPYDDDVLFTYLWKRKFATQAYQAGNVARMMDRMVADFIGFADVRPNYAMLLEIPARLKDHAAAKRAAAQAVREHQAEIERSALTVAGFTAKERSLSEARYKLAAAEATLTAKRTELAAIDQVRDALLKLGSEPGYAEALATIAQGDAQDDVAQLYAEARRTQTIADEAIVRRIEQIETKLGATEQELRKLRSTAQTIAERRAEAETVRERFRGAGYDHPHARFGNEVDIGTILGSLLEGAVRSGVVWDVIRGGFSTRGPFDRGNMGMGGGGFGGSGGGGLPFPFPIPGGGDSGPRGGGWRIPDSQGGWFPTGGGGGNGGDSSGGGSSNSDDGFSTGESF